VITRPRNAGLAVYDVHGTRRQARKDGKGWHESVKDSILTDAEGLPVKTDWEPIVSYETWDAVCSLLADPKRHTRKSPGRVHLLSGIAICEACERTMGTTVRKLKSGGNRPVYACKRIGCMKIVRDLTLTDKRVIDTITKRLAKPDALVALAKPTVDTKALRAQIATLEAQITKANAEYDDGIIDGQRLKGRIERVQAKLRPLHDQLIGERMSHDVKELAGKPNARELFEALPLDRRRGVIDTLAVVTIRKQQAGGRFDPKAVTVEPR